MNMEKLLSQYIMRKYITCIKHLFGAWSMSQVFCTLIFVLNLLRIELVMKKREKCIREEENLLLYHASSIFYI